VERQLGKQTRVGQTKCSIKCWFNERSYRWINTCKISCYYL